MEIHLGDDALENSIEKGIRATIMAGALQLILKELTPERLGQFITGVLDEALQDLNKWKLKSKLMELAEPMIASQCRHPEVINQLEVAVKEGIQRFLKDVPDMVYEQTKNTVVGALVDAHDRRRR
jgi:hypothetical protein